MPSDDVRLFESRLQHPVNLRAAGRVHRRHRVGDPVVPRIARRVDHCASALRRHSKRAARAQRRQHPHRRLSLSGALDDGDELLGEVIGRQPRERDGRLRQAAQRVAQERIELIERRQDDGGPALGERSRARLRRGDGTRRGRLSRRRLAHAIHPEPRDETRDERQRQDWADSRRPPRRLVELPRRRRLHRLRRREVHVVQHAHTVTPTPALAPSITTSMPSKSSSTVRVSPLRRRRPASEARSTTCLRWASTAKRKV